MSQPTTVSLTAPRNRRGIWRAALDGLTPSTLALIAALLFARALSWALGTPDTEPIANIVRNCIVGFLQLLAMTAPTVLAIVATGNLGPQHGPKRAAALAAAVILSPAVGALLRLVVADFLGSGPRWDQAASLLRGTWPRFVLLGAMLTVALEVYRREVVAVRATQQAVQDRAALERELAESRLQVLQAQIEPHFLFNTLANMRRLYDTDHAGGCAMLDSLMRYLEIALPGMRDTKAMLDRDARLAEAYLRIHQVRMGRRLAFGIDIPAELYGQPVPPMMLLTLIENAVKHGIQPLQHGGTIRVSARAEARQLILTVADSGVGFAPGSGTGTGLANIRARLAAQFGASASLSLNNNDLGGATATISLPLAGTPNAP